MIEPIICFVLGTAIAIGVVWFLVKQTSITSPETSFNTIVGGFGGIFFLCVAAIFGSILYEDWSEYNLLNEKGEVRTVPLLQVEVETGAKRPIYLATYPIDESTREETITRSQYAQLLSQDSVEIMVYENTSRIVGSKPKYGIIILVMFVGSFSGVVICAFVVQLLKIVRERAGAAARHDG